MSSSRPRPAALHGPAIAACVMVGLSFTSSAAGAIAPRLSATDPGEEESGSIYRVMTYCDYMPAPAGGHEGRKCGISFKQVSRDCDTALPVNRCSYWHEDQYCVGGPFWRKCFDHVWYHWSLGQGVLINSPVPFDVCQNRETCIGISVGDWDEDETHKGCYYWIELEPPLDDVYHCDGHTPVGEPLGALGGGSQEA